MKKVYSIISLVLSLSTVASSLQNVKVGRNVRSTSRRKASRETPQIVPTTATAAIVHGGSQPSAIRSITTCWIFLIASILLECLDTTVSKLARDQESTPLFFLACSLNLISMYGINISMTRLPVSLAYTVWTALGTLVVTLIGAACFQEPMGMWQIACLTMITVGVIGLNLQEE
ncbi:hypothetical protein FisN_2Lu031 [Fistulifera solaris]|uniref:Small multidrug resistance protein n=1 Tax=Fistulifera solaris TaxID=1519565 RepID=A0A1Z5JWJ1_FISSO|nr:hypothetical protein FisN_2Lu031 [Fistulifera solaris]|eukprot:GAX18405.1 hypothetical protein FisN_2Lu031 [Fistulifera solaris]